MAKQSSMPQVRQDFFPLVGGLDLVTPAIEMPPGKVIDSINFETAISGGYRRINGYERYDGHASPTANPYWILPANITGTVAVGNTVVGATSAATANVLAVVSGYLVVTALTGTFLTGENLTVSSVVQGAVTGIQSQAGAATPALDAAYRYLAQYQRAFISAVPGSGSITGVQVYNGNVYAFRNNAGNTANVMWKATASGWQQVTFGYQIQFNAATAQINAGVTITGGTSGATATVVIPLLMTGTWTTAGVGSLIITPISGTFVSGEAIKVSGTSCATSTTVSSQITRSPCTGMQFSQYNFSGAAGMTKLYGVDGVNTCFEFDGTNYVPIHTGMATDAPNCVCGVAGYLWLSFGSSVQYSAVGAPYSWTVVLGAGQFLVNDVVTGFLPQKGTIYGNALAIFTASRTFILYGQTSANFVLVPSIVDVGIYANTMQMVSNDAYGLTARGIQSLITTLNYGNFDYVSISHMVQPWILANMGLQVCSTSLRSKNQYRIYYSNGYCLSVGLTGDKFSGVMPLYYQNAPTCIHTTTPSSGSEVTYFGSTNGFVYQDNIGTSQDGAAINAYARLPFFHDKSPNMRKRWRRAVFELTVDSFANLNIGYDLGYGNLMVRPGAPIPTIPVNSTGGYWDEVYWDAFTWDQQMVNNPSITLAGTEKTLSLLFASNDAISSPYTIQGVTIMSSIRRMERQ